MDDVLWLDATAQAALVASGEVSGRELAEAAITRIEKVDGEVNAVIHRRFEKALDEIDAGLPAGPFHGVPIVIKDLFADSAGDPAHNGNVALRDAGRVATADSWLVGRLRKAGFSFVGRTNTPEFGLVPVTEPAAYGACRNPWDLSRSPGGSSGGSAAAVAAGMVAVAHASDGGGSIRIPASMCGLVGLKPSRGRTTLGPDGDESGLSVQHVVSRSVRDSAALLDVLCGPGPGDMVVAPPPERPFAAEVGADPGRLRIGVLAESPAGALDPDCEAAVRSAARVLEGLGHDVSDDRPTIDPEAARRFGTRWVVNTRLRLLALGEQLGREVTADDVEPLTWAFAGLAEHFSSVDVAAAMAGGARLTRQLGMFWVDHDLLVTPTLGQLPPLVGELTPAPDDPLGTQVATGVLVPFTTHFNVTGQPAISLPLHMSPGGLPVGVQLVAAYGREDLLIRAASQLEQAAPWAGRDGQFCRQSPVARTHVALLRGINVGGHNKVAMKDLRALLEGMGFSEVETYIQSGNAVFSSPGVVAADPIEDAIAAQLGVTCAVVLLTRDELAKAIAGNPFPEPEDPKRLHVVFRASDITAADIESVDRSVEKARAKVAGHNDEVAIVGRHVYLALPDGIGRSELAAQLARGVMATGTARNWATVRRLDEMLRS